GQDRDALSLQERFGALRDLARDAASEPPRLDLDARSRLYRPFALVKDAHADLDAYRATEGSGRHPTDRKLRLEDRYPIVGRWKPRAVCRSPGDGRFAAASQPLRASRGAHGAPRVRRGFQVGQAPVADDGLAVDDRSADATGPRNVAGAAFTGASGAFANMSTM